MMLFIHWLFWLKNWRFSTNNSKGFIVSLFLYLLKRLQYTHKASYHCSALSNISLYYSKIYYREIVGQFSFLTYWYTLLRHLLVCFHYLTFLCRKLCSVPTKKSRKITWNFTISFHCKCTIATELNLQKQYKTHKNLVFSAAYCPFFSGISAVVLILLLGVCESEEFPTAEYNKSQK